MGCAHCFCIYESIRMALDAFMGKMGKLGNMSR